VPGYTPLTLAKLWQHTHGMANTLSYFVFHQRRNKKTFTFKGWSVLAFGSAAVLGTTHRDSWEVLDLLRVPVEVDWSPVDNDVELVAPLSVKRTKTDLIRQE